MKVVVAGGSGWLGSALCRSLTADGHNVVVLSRHPPERLGAGTACRWVLWDGRSLGPWAAEIEGADAVVNFCGESIADKRWNVARKEVLRQSRIGPTGVLVAAMEASGRCPAVLVQQSAVGYYGHRRDDPITEEEPPGDDFLARLVIDWEAAALQAERLGVRVVLMRTGIVLGPGGGALERLALPFRLFVGGPIGSRRQWLPWVHIDDVLGLFRLALERSDLSGPLNVTAPEPVTMEEFAAAIGGVLRRPSWLPAPWLLLRITLGEVADALVVSQRVLPVAAQRLGYGFREPTLEPALRKALGR